MADEKLTQLPLLDPVEDPDQLYVVRDGVSYQTTVAAVHASITPGAAAWGDITGTLGDQTDLANALALKAALASPALTGTPTAPTAAPGTSTTQLATTAFDAAAIVAERTATATLTNKTLTAPVVNSPTGIVKGDVGLGNVDNTSNATERAAVATLTNKTISGASNTLSALPAAGISGVIPIANLATGTPDGTKFIKDDGTLAVPAGSGTVTSVSSANGDLTVANPTTTPALTVVSAPKLTTARDINGVAFDGTANVTVTVPVATGITGLGTGIATALAVNVGSAGAPVLFNGALGTPSSGTLTSATGLPISSGVSGLGSNVATFLATPSSANLAAALTNETGTGVVVFSDSPAFTTATSLDAVDMCPQIKQNVQSGSYTMVLADANRHIYTTTGTTATWTIPANSSVAYPIGTTLTFVMDATGVRNIAITTDTLAWAPTGATGTRVLTGLGVATALKVSATRWVISGPGLT